MILSLIQQLLSSLSTQEHSILTVRPETLLETICFEIYRGPPCDNKTEVLQHVPLKERSTFPNMNRG